MTNPLAPDLDHVLEHTRDVWEDLRGERIFVTGGTGFIGCWLLETFLWANARLGLRASMTVLSRNPEAFRRKAPRFADDAAIRFISGDVRSFTFPPGQYSHIIHAAAPIRDVPDEQEPLVMLDTIVQGTRQVLEFAIAAQVRKFLFISSGAAYGIQPPHITEVPETYSGAPDTTNARAAYGEGKRVAELLCAIYHGQHGIQTKVARCFSFVGPYLPIDQGLAIGDFLRDSLSGGPIRITGDGTPLRSYLYAADLAIWLWSILSRGAACRIYNVGADRALSIADLAREVARAAGSDVGLDFSKPPATDAAPSRYVPCTGRAEAELGLRCWVPLADALGRTIAALRTQPGNGEGTPSHVKGSSNEP